MRNSEIQVLCTLSPPAQLQTRSFSRLVHTGVIDEIAFGKLKNKNKKINKYALLKEIDSWVLYRGMVYFRISFLCILLIGDFLISPKKKAKPQ